MDEAVGDLEKSRLVCADVGECRLDALIGAIQRRSAHARATLRSKLGWKTKVVSWILFVLKLHVAALVWANEAAAMWARAHEGKAHAYNDDEDLGVQSSRHLGI